MTVDLLVLGGTAWLGGAIARHATDRGHRVTCLARGEAGAPPDGVSWVRADRSSPQAYDAVADRTWDAVVDVSWQPDSVRSALAALAGRTAHWVYVSSTSVYPDNATVDTDESAPTHPAHEGAGPVDWDVYGPAKVACEDACRSVLGEDRVLLARSGLIGGYGDRSDRLGWWPARLARADDDEPVLVPPLEAACQVVDVEDLAAWLVSCAERRTAGTMNAVGPVTSVAEVLAASASAAQSRPRCVEASDEWLVEHGVEPWMGEESLPLWLPRPEYAGFMTRRSAPAVAAGLTFRPLTETVTASLAWERELGLDRRRRAGLSTGRELELLGRLGGLST